MWHEDWTHYEVTVVKGKIERTADIQGKERILWPNVGGGPYR